MARKFMYNGMELPDIDPKMKPDEIRGVHAVTYPELETATVSGPTKRGDDQVYTFARALGRKG